QLSRSDVPCPLILAVVDATDGPERLESSSECHQERDQARLSGTRDERRIAGIPEFPRTGLQNASKIEVPVVVEVGQRLAERLPKRGTPLSRRSQEACQNRRERARALALEPGERALCAVQSANGTGLVRRGIDMTEIQVL